MTQAPVFHKQPSQAERRLTSASQTWQWANAIRLALVVGVAYFLAARLSLSLLTAPDGWPCSGRRTALPSAL